MNFDEIITNINPDEDYKISEISKMTGLSYSAILAHITRQSFPSRKIFNRFYVKGKDLQKYLTGK